jgi:GH25 family lysozyme M1 (1,4-beta-N-acetylmuramidase)
VKLTGHHKGAVLTIAAAAVTDIACGLAYAAAEHTGTGYALYCAAGNAVTEGACTAPATAAGHLIDLAEFMLVVPLFAATFSLFTSGLAAGHVQAAEQRIKDHVEARLRRHLGSRPPSAERLYDSKKERTVSESPAAAPVMFRAGTIAGAATPELTASVASPGIVLCDVSEFQPDIADAAYLQWSKAVVIRAMYGGSHDDGAWYGGGRRDALHAGGALFVGIYQYLVAGQDAAVQAHALAALVGTLRPGEKLICDIEEGPSSVQAVRWRQWSAVITAAYGARSAPWLYAGLDFATEAGLNPDWLAAYRDTEPARGQLLWQFSDAYPVPGVGTCDASVYHGTIGELAALGWQATAPPVVTPPVVTPPKPVPVPAPVTGLPVLTEGDAGEDVRTLQGLLTARGYPTLIDGAFGPATQAVLLAFQRHAGLTPDGVAGPLTWPALLG